MKKLLSIICFILISISANSEKLDAEQALDAAVSFFSNASEGRMRHVQAKQLHLASRKQDFGCYIFERDGGGTVFVADDDAVGYTVLGYTDSGNFDADSIPPGLQDWLSQVKVLMDAVHEGKIDNSRNVVRKAGSIVVDKLIKTTWGQGSPYYNLTPEINGSHCVTGCVATAMAQVLNYWQWPQHGYGTGTCTVDGQKSARDLSQTTYDWDNMLDSYSYGYTTAEADAVAELMRDCGYASGMKYDVDASGTVVYAKDLVEYFHYSTNAKDLYHNNFGTDTWHSFIKSDLDNKRPVLYRGSNDDSGHRFIIDGYRTDDYFHVNWGWRGSYDGYFLLTDMMGYNTYQSAIFELEPDYGDVSSFSYTLQDSVLTVNGEGDMPFEYTMQTAPWREQCKGIRKIVIGSGITSVVDGFGIYNDNEDGKWASYYFCNLKEVSLPEGLLKLGCNSFFNTLIENINLPSSLTYLNDAFSQCGNLSSLHLGPNVITYHCNMRYGGDFTIEVDKGNPYICSRNNIIYNKEGTWMLFNPRYDFQYTIPDGTEKIDFFNSLLGAKCIISYPEEAPSFTDLDGSQSSSGVFVVPYGATGYDNLVKDYFPGWKVLYSHDLAKTDPDMRCTSDNGIFTLHGFGAMVNGYTGENSYQAKKVCVDEGIFSIDGYFLYDISDCTELELPSTFVGVSSYYFDLPNRLNRITCAAPTAPLIDSFHGGAANGVLRVPSGATGYDDWLTKLPSGWQMEYYTPEALVEYMLPGSDVKYSVSSLDGWKIILKQYPNTMGVYCGDGTALPYLADNLSFADATARGGYRCPYYRLTDLSMGYSTTSSAPYTGFRPIVGFEIDKGEYTRKLYKGYNSSCLPFSISDAELNQEDRIYTYSYFDSAKEDAIFSLSTSVKSGNPCYIVASDVKKWSIDLAGKYISSEEPPESGSFCGTYETTSRYQNIGFSPRSSDGKFAPLSLYLHPMRACFIPGSSSNANIRLVDTDATDIKVTRPANEALGSVRLNGIRVSGASDKGIYIINGQKVLR